MGAIDRYYKIEKAVLKSSVWAFVRKLPDGTLLYKYMGKSVKPMGEYLTQTEIIHSLKLSGERQEKDDPIK